MSEPLSTKDVDARIRDVATAQSDEFRRLIEIAKLDPTRDLRFHDWSGVSFAGQDLRGFDFTGARLVHCDFNNALIENAIFDQAVLDDTGRISRTDLSKATDWHKHKATWHPSTQPVADGHLRPGQVFQDAPFAPRMVVIPPGEVTWSMPTDTTTKHNQVSQPIAVSKLRITESEYLESNKFPSRLFRFFTDEQPMRTVATSSYYVNAYIMWLRERTGLPYRPLTRTEWEYIHSPRGKNFRLLDQNHLWEWCSDADIDPTEWNFQPGLQVDGLHKDTSLSGLAFRVARDLMPRRDDTN